MVKYLLTDFIKNPAEAKAFMEDSNKYLSTKGISITEDDKNALISIIKSWDVPIARGGGHTNLNTHTSYNASDGHVDRDSHTNHTSSH